MKFSNDIFCRFATIFAEKYSENLNLRAESCFRKIFKNPKN